MAEHFNLSDGVRAQRKLMLTFVQWGGTWGGTDPNADDATYTSGNTALLGARTEDSSIEFNLDAETTTDILGYTYTDINKTEPQQDFDPFYIIGGTGGAAKLAQYLTKAALANRITDYDSQFNVIIVTAYIDNNSSGAGLKYYAVRHRNCSIYPTSMGGDSYVSLPIEVHLSNRICEGTASGLTETELGFTPNGSL